MRIILSGGGSGGHVFPAIAIADAIKELMPEAEILFVGAKGKIEMEKVPKAGYPIEGLWISGFHRKLTFRNLLFPLKLASSLGKAALILNRFKPEVVVGVGGFASGPVLEIASRLGKKTLIQEQNSYAGVTNKLLGSKVDRICVAYDNMDRFFPAEKIVLTGNPVRKDLKVRPDLRQEAFEHFGFDPEKRVLFVFGGSLGAESINKAMAANANLLKQHPDVQVLWQVGKLYYESFRTSETAQLEQVEMRAFIERMDLAYQMADLVICRAGALTISELCLLGQPAILIPSPNVAEDHQTKNARALEEKEAAVLLKDENAKEQIISRSLEVLNDPALLTKLKENSLTMAMPHAARDIAKEVLKLAGTNI